MTSVWSAEEARAPRARQKEKVSQASIANLAGLTGSRCDPLTAIGRKAPQLCHAKYIQIEIPSYIEALIEITTPKN